MRLVIALDGTPASEDMLAVAGPWAREWGAEVALLNVVAPGETSPTPVAQPAITYDGASLAAAELAPAATGNREVPAEAESRSQAVERALAEHRDRLEQLAAQALPGSPIELDVVVSDDPAEEIADFAVRHQADMIVMGPHRRSGLTRVLRRSVTDAVIRRATIPVLVIGDGVQPAGSTRPAPPPPVWAPDDYPRTVVVGGHELTLRLMTAGHRDALLEFASALPADDLLFLRSDISQSHVLDDWLDDLDRGIQFTVLASTPESIVGYVTIERGRLPWMSGVAELDVVVAPALRGSGLGRTLVEEGLGAARQVGAYKVVAQMTLDQRSAVALFRNRGFQPEAVLRKHVVDREGGLHDLVMMSYDLAAAGA